MNTLHTLHRLEHECPVLSSEEQHCPLLGECIKYRMPLKAQVKLAGMIDTMDRSPWAWFALVRLGRLVKKFRNSNEKKNGTADGRRPQEAS